MNTVIQHLFARFEKGMLKELGEGRPELVVLVQTDGHHVPEVSTKAAVVGQPRRRPFHNFLELLERIGPVREWELASYSRDNEYFGHIVCENKETHSLTYSTVWKYVTRMSVRNGAHWRPRR